MKNIFEMPEMTIRCFELENVVTTASDPTRSANEKARDDLNSKGVGGVFDLTIVP